MKLAAVTAILLLFAAGYVQANPEVYTAFVQDISPPLKEMIPDRNCPGVNHVVTENEGSLRTTRPHQTDTVVQTAPIGASIPSTSRSKSFAGFVGVLLRCTTRDRRPPSVP